jgi:iron-sulfur cluster repair protein YtfE (RIC family)
MKPPEARDHLLRQHSRLRELLGRAEALGARVLAEEPVSEGFQQALAELQTALAEHNQAEEAMLEPLLARGDAWAPQRIARMLEEHAGEHAVLRDVLSGSELEIARRMADFAEHLSAHMDAEERTFLAPTVLREP